MLAGLLALVILVTRLFAETPFACVLHRTFVEQPLDIAQRMERRHLILVAILLCSGQSVMLLGPELAMTLAVELSLYADAIVAIALATAATRVRAAWTRFKAGTACVFAIARPRPRARRTRQIASSRSTPANDEDHPAVPMTRAA